MKVRPALPLAIFVAGCQMIGRHPTSKQPNVVDLLNSRDLNERRLGIAMAAKHPGTMLDDKLVQIALYDPVPGIAEDAATALGNMGNGGLISLYLRNPSSFSGTEETGRRRRIADSAYSLRAPGCILALKMLANDADSEIRQTAYVGLSKTYDPEVGRILADASTHDPDPRYRELARESLKRWKKKQAAGRPSTADFTMPPDA